MNLEDYINNLRDDHNQKHAEAVNEHQKNEEQKNNFDNNFKKFVLEKFVKDLKELARKIEHFNVLEIENRIMTNEYSLNFEILLNINDSFDQYYININSNRKRSYEGVFFKFESSNSRIFLEEDFKTFDELENLDVEEYLINTLNEFN